MGATATDRFSRREFLRLLDITDKQLAYWEKLGIVSPRKAAGDDFYDFRDLISLRTAKQLIQSGVSANRLRLALAALNQKLSKVEQPLTELRILSNGRDIIVDHDGAHLEPISGQFVLNFDTRELRDRVRVMPERNANDWFALALQYESDPETHLQAIDAYRRVLAITPNNVEALINLGMLSYEQGDLENASACFLRAVTGDPNNSVASDGAEKTGGSVFEVALFVGEHAEIDQGFDVVGSYREHAAVGVDGLQVRFGVGLVLQSEGKPVIGVALGHDADFVAKLASVEVENELAGDRFEMRAIVIDDNVAAVGEDAEFGERLFDFG